MTTKYRTDVRPTREINMNTIHKTPVTFHRLRLIAGCALIGSVMAGVFFGWIDAPVDPRAFGAGIGAVAGAIKVFHLF